MLRNQLTINLKFFTTLLLAALTVASLNAQSSVAFGDSIDRLLEPWKRKDVPGISITVIREGKTIYSQTLGMADIKLDKVNDNTTRFWIASVSKQFTAAAVYQLAMENKIVLSYSVRKYLKDLPAMFEEVTIDQLLHHTSGIRDGFVLTALSKKPPSQYTNENVLHYLNISEGFNFAPGTQFEYNNSGYVILAVLVEKIVGLSYPDYMKKKIFLPLKMNDTYVSPSFPADGRLAQGYLHAGDGNLREHHFEGNTYGSTGIISTLADLGKWSAFLQDSNLVPGLASVGKAIITTGALRDGTVIAYGGGLEKFTYKGKTVYEHFGADEGFKANILYFPATKVSVIGLVNNSSYYDLSKLLYQISDFIQDGRTNTPIPLSERTSPGSTFFYYNSSVPQLARVERFSDYVMIANTPSGHSLPFAIKEDTLMSADPVPAAFIQRGEYLQVVDAYYHNEIKLFPIQPSLKTDDLKSFEGIYYSKELGASYTIVSDGKGLQLEFVPGLTFNLYRITNTDFQFDYQGPNFLQFAKNGFAFSREGVRKLLFKRHNENELPSTQ